MTTVHIRKFYPTAEPLQNLIKYFWVQESGRQTILNHKILPVNNIDLIFNFLSPMRYEKEDTLHATPGNVFFAGLMSDHMVLKQCGPILTIGVAFFPIGFYPFFGIPVSEFKNGVFGVDAICSGLSSDLEGRIWDAERIPEKIALLEEFFLERLARNTAHHHDACKLLNRFYTHREGVQDFCRRYGVHPRTLQRLFNRHVGATPKQFFRLSRFQGIVYRLLQTDRTDLTTLAHDFDYFDQTHFIKDFKSFSGSSPLKFIQEKGSVRQIMKIS